MCVTFKTAVLCACLGHGPQDVSVGLYLLALAKRGEVRVVPRQHKDNMPLDFEEHCATRQSVIPLLVLHRFDPATAPCLWALAEQRRREPASAVPAQVDFCRCASAL
ncbi:unnamed protein product [Polarella glacialis]|uniref:Uncharacterized protein n=1 Tax=Polarella glacialis TaxID=89957 RepID=A0A813L5F1_POLGL|nr:unnamed protein product [Polarella glacialis]